MDLPEQFPPVYPLEQDNAGVIEVNPIAPVAIGDGIKMVECTIREGDVVVFVGSVIVVVVVVVVAVGNGGGREGVVAV